MVTKADQVPAAVKEALFGGNGEVHYKHLGSVEQLGGTGRLFSIMTLNPGCSIGDHTHVNEFEFYYILSGTALYNNNGTPCQITAGDVTYCPNGEAHGVVNNSDQPMIMLAFVGFPKA